MRRRSSFLYAATAVLVVSSSALLYALRHGWRWLAIGGFIGMAVAAALFLLSLFSPRRKVDWERVRAEQRLWESGPIGRAWLRIRQKL